MCAIDNEPGPTMNVITVARTYGAGGSEVARLLAEKLGWQVLDRELLHQAAQVEHVPDADLERLDEQEVRLWDRLRWTPPQQKYLEGIGAATLQAAERGNVVLVGRGTAQLLKDRPETLHLRLVAPLDARAARIAQRENLALEQARKRCQEVDQTRARFLAYFFGQEAACVEQYDLIINTSRLAYADTVSTVVDLVRRPTAAPPTALPERRILTLARQDAVGARALLPPLAERLGLTLWDRSLLDREAVRLGASVEELAQVDEHPPGLLDRLRPGSLHHRYVHTLGQVLNDRATEGKVLIVGRGGQHFLAQRPEAFHVRMIAAQDVRVSHLMTQRWVRADVAQKLLAHSDDQRRRFFQHSLGADWEDPLAYHCTVNVGRLGARTVDVLVGAARRHWQHRQGGALGT